MDLHIRGRRCVKCEVAYCDELPPSHVTLSNYYTHGPLLVAFTKSSGIGIPPLEPELTLPPAAVAKVADLDLPRRYIVVHCRSNEASRDWTDDKWRQLIRLLKAAGHRVVEIGTTSICDDLALNTCGRLTIPETAEVIRKADLFIGVDSGPAHLAHACRRPAVILLGSYRAFARYCPYTGSYGDGRLATLIQHDGPASGIEVAVVLEQVSTRLGVGAAPAQSVAEGLP